jgi:Transposase zinc-binding domain
MSRPRFEVADIIRSAGTDFIERNRSRRRWTHLKVLLAIARCRTAALGGHIDECASCGHRATISYNSCRNRHCPKCQTGGRERWIAARRRELLPTPYVHVVFTLPPQLAALALQNRKLIYVCCSGPAPKPCWRWHATPAISEPRSASSACSTPGTRDSNFIPMSIVSFPPADFRLINAAGFDRTHASSFPSPYCGACFAASSSPA